MRNNILIILASCLILTSCNKVMDTKPLDSYTGNDIWNNYSLAEGYIFSCYANTIGNIFSWEYDAITKSVKNHPWGGSYTAEKTEQIDRNNDEGGMAISADGKAYQVFDMNEQNGQPLKFTPKRYLFPVPQSKLVALPALTQNAGW